MPMFERPLQRAAMVEVAGVAGQVREMGLRATIVTTFDGADVIAPNGLLLADKVVNWKSRSAGPSVVHCPLPYRGSRIRCIGTP
jgi:small-conductance mechanosensitive channel